MTSHTPRTPVYENFPAVHPNTLPPPPPRTATFPGAQRREHGSRPPALSVVPTTHIGSHQSTPLSAVSHQSPFSPTTATPIVVSAGATSRGTSPMALRNSANFSVPYDPRDWASGDVRANQAARARQQQGEEGLASPPPPYSPQNANRNASDRVVSGLTMGQDEDTGSRRESQENISTTFPVQAGTTHQVRSRQTPPSHRHTLHMGHSIPPPPPSPGMQAGMPRNVLSSITYQDGSYSRESSPGPPQHPPAARRAVSANAGFPHRADEYEPPGRSTSTSRWQPGMPLPGPPPGPPPPASSRSQSMTNARERSSSSGMQRVHPLRYTVHESGLGPVPPTPAGWVEGSPLPSTADEVLHIDTQVNDARTIQSQQSANLPVTQPTGQTNAGALSRSSALRDSSIKSLRERRAQNRTSRIVSPSELSDMSIETSPPDDGIIIPGPNSARISADPASGRRLPSGKRTAFSPLANVLATEEGITESPLNVRLPPNPLTNPRAYHDQGLRSAGLPPKSLPTPPLSQKAPLSAHSGLTSARGSFSMSGNDGLDDFVQDAIRRHTDFLEREKSARTDLERLALFTDFVAQESSIRQRRYNTTIQSGTFDIQAARDRLFEPSTQRNSVSGPGRPLSSDQQISNHVANPQVRPDSTYWKDYQPALSPIASMDYDEMSSRGRAPSRWWESQTGSQTGERMGQIQRSKRESKYMGLSKEFLMAHSPSDEHPSLSPQSFFPLNNGYPQEKADPRTFGYYDDEEANPTPTFAPKHPETPRQLDISRFITLPPPYPRHHPAVNNSHPELAQYRTTVRTLSDLSDIKTRRSRQQLSVDALRTDLQRKISEARRTFRANVQAQIQEGSITYAEAAEAEEANKMHEFELEKQTIKAEFDTLQDVVINPLHDLLHDRIKQLDTSIQHLQDDLHNEARRQDPDRPQEEGDETPELLEKLTQLKWLFDTREQIHKECFELLTERNDKYKAIVLFPYKWNNNMDKVRDTESFFEADTQTRFVAFCTESSKRHQSFLTVIDQHVMRGVELQSSAFWDIAPGLLDLLQKLPEDMRNLPAIQIPAKEYEENPSYHHHPQQYLYSLLSHAEKSTYQFIESQTNLYCLLHEAKTGMLAARYRLLQLQNASSGTSNPDLLASRQREDAALTGELKQKASMIEQQWLEALGSQLQGTRERVKLLLEQDDAWDEIAEDE